MEEDTAPAENRTADTTQPTDYGRGFWAVGPETVRVWEDDLRILHVSVNGEEFHDVRPRRVFPVSGKAPYISFIAEKDKEVALLTTPRGLDKESRRVLERALRHMYYAPKILEVSDVSETMGVSLWHVRTDQGYATFEISDRQRFIRTLAGGRYIITDVDGNRFEIENISQLDKKSQSRVYHET